MTFRPWGSFAVCVGLAGFISLTNLEKYFLFLIPFIVLLILRVGYRFLLRKQLRDDWGVSRFQNWRMIIIQIIGVLLFVIFTINQL